MTIAEQPVGKGQKPAVQVVLDVLEKHLSGDSNWQFLEGAVTVCCEILNINRAAICPGERPQVVEKLKSLLAYSRRTHNSAICRLLEATITGLEEEGEGGGRSE